MDTSVPLMAFGEFWDTCEYTDGVLNYNQDNHRQRTVNWCDKTGGTSAAFDFTTKGGLLAHSTTADMLLLASAGLRKSLSPPNMGAGVHALCLTLDAKEPQQPLTLMSPEPTPDEPCRRTIAPGFVPCCAFSGASSMQAALLFFLPLRLAAPGTFRTFADSKAAAKLCLTAPGTSQAPPASKPAAALLAASQQWVFT